MAKYTSKPFGTKSQGDRSTPNKTQVAAAYDILSEGEIEGLANGFASVYVNDVPIIDTLANEIVKDRKITLNTTANSTTVSSSVFNEVNQLNNNNKAGLSLGGRSILIEKAGKKGTGIASATKDSNTVTTSSSFFTSYNISGLRTGRIKGYVRIAGAGADGTDLVSTATFVSTTEITIEDLVATTVSNVDIFIDLVARVSSISGNDAVLSTAPGVTLSNTISILTGANASESTLKNLYNIENLQFALNTGTLTQAPIQINSSFGQASIIASPNIELEQNDLRANVGTTGNLVSGYNNEMDEPSQNEGTAADTLLTSAFLDVSNPSEIDEVHLTFNLPNCHAMKPSSGAKGPSFVELQIWFEYSTDGGASYTSELAFGPTNDSIMTRNTGRAGRNVNFIADNSYSTPNNGYIRPSKQQYAAFVEEFVINTEEFQPFDDWRIRIRRITDLNPIDGSFRHNNAISLSTVESIVKDKLTYPHTAYAYTSFNAKDYEGQVPSRAFTLKGMKIQVPTNYLTRDETGSAASYTRNITSGAAESSYQNWDGNFRGDIETFNQSSINHEKVYCDNPVWVMYDMLNNNRYGMGQFVDKQHIDKYELFRLAKYCDEEIPDGNGGTEPRFTCNLYLQEAGEATTVLKQLASIFHGMAIWANGEFTATADQPKQPVALFSKANVVDGQFTYEGTGERVRTNQVKVTWNDPEDSYRQSTEYVEDYENIAETGRIVRAEQLAFGCTSRGQAHRMGKWKLLSERTERETVSFETGQNAIGLLPGQIIGIQDADRDRVSYAGRVSNTGTLSTTVTPLDRTISLPQYDSNFPHELVLMYPKGGAYLIDDNATIGGVDYVKGDLIPSISSSTAAANIDANIEWSEDFRTETQKITTSAGNVSSLTVDTAFTSAPDTETIWALKLYNTDGTQKVGAIKEYKIIAIKEDDEKFSIAAAEYNREKFAEIEKGYALEARPEKESPDPDDVVPAPRNLIVTVEPMESSDSTAATANEGVTTGNKVTITWDYPENSDGSKYKFANGFEIVHNFNGDEETELVNTVNQSFTVENISAGVYNIRIRTKTSIGSVSQFIQRNVEILEKEFNTPGVSRTSLVPQGGTSNRNLTLDSSSGLAELSDSSYTFTNPNGVTFTNDSTNVDTYKQSFSGTTTTAYLVFDASETTDKLKALEIITDNSVSPSIEYFAELNATNNGLSSVTGTVQIDKESNQVNGTNTLFTSEFNTGDLVKIKNGSSTTQTTSGATTSSKSVTLSGTNTNIEVGQTIGNIPAQLVGGETVSPGPVFVEAISGTSLTLSTKLTIADGTNLSFTPKPAYKRIRGIESNTLMFFEEIVLRPYTGSSLEQQSFAPDFTNDSILAKIKLDGSTYSIEELYVSSGGEKGDPGPKGAPGTKGPTGGPGDPGEKGAPGDPGPKGVPGDPGEKGSPGEKGIKGAIGPDGPKGEEGPKGEVGPKGIPGPDGPKGEVGDKGVIGVKGIPGPDGPKGDTGDKGVIGVKGIPGPDGPKGPTGEKGVIGVKGIPGPDGSKGEAGAKGEIGGVGPKGELGDKGQKGPDGPKGGTGLKGDEGDDVFFIYYDGETNDALNSNATVDRDNPPLAPNMNGGSSAISGGFRLTQADGTLTDWYTEATAISEWYFTATAVSASITATPRAEWTVSGYLQGEKGEIGPKGEIGVKGSIGAKGPDGEKGAAGQKGAIGAKGPDGEKGAAGQKGAIGAKGPEGAKGEIGGPGPKGSIGQKGPEGAKGEIGGPGPKGSIGQKGPEGLKGEIGGPGPKGAIGAKGPEGLKGEIGGPGPKGPTGQKGIEGPKGEVGGPGGPGPKGPTGDKGAAGQKGPEGDPGAKGPGGEKGQVGIKGSDGSPGSSAPAVVIGFDNTVDTDTERNTALKSFSGLSVVEINSVYWDATTGVPHQNQASTTSNPALTPLTGTNALISADTIVVQDLILPTSGAKVSGSSLGVFNYNSERYTEVCDVGVGAGFYQGFVRAKGGTGQVKTIHFLFSDGYVNTTVTSGGSDTAELNETDSGVVYKTPRIQYLPGHVSESRLTVSDDTTNIPLAFRYDGTGTVTLYMFGQGNGNSLTVGYVEGRFVKFGVSTPNSFGFTNQTGVSTSTTITSNTITLSGSSFVSGTASVTGGSYKVNSGSYTTSSSTVSNGDQITLQQTSSSVNGTSVSCQFTVSETSQTWFVTTSGTAPPSGPSGPPGGPGPCPICCVHESMLIATGEDMKSIYDISIGDKVISHNFETGQDELTEVTDLIVVERDVDYKVNNLIMTEDHPVYLEDGSKASINPEATLLNYRQEVNQLKIGDSMKVLGGTLEEIKTIERFPGTEKNFAIQTKYNNFYANGILVDSVIRRD